MNKVQKKIRYYIETKAHLFHLEREKSLQRYQFMTNQHQNLQTALEFEANRLKEPLHPRELKGLFFKVFCLKPSAGQKTQLTRHFERLYNIFLLLPREAKNQQYKLFVQSSKFSKSFVITLEYGVCVRHLGLAPPCILSPQKSQCQPTF